MRRHVNDQQMSVLALGEKDNDETVQISTRLGCRTCAEGLMHYEEQTEDEAVAEDEASFEDSTQTMMAVPNELVPAVRELIAKHQV